METIATKMNSHDLTEDQHMEDVVAPTMAQPVVVSLSDDDASKKGKKRKSKARTSKVWDYYTVIEGTNKAQCIYCKAVKSACSLNGTSGLRNHTLRCPKNPNKADCKQKLLVFETVDANGTNGKGGIKNNISTSIFDKGASRNALARMIVKDELSFRIVEGEGFREYSSKLEPRFVLPSRVTIAQDIWNMFIVEKKRLKCFIATNSNRVSLTTDTWSSLQNINYMVLAAHFIDNEWKLHKRIINFSQIENHKGETIAKEIDQKLREWGIKKVFSITVDNATSNDVGVGILRKKFVREGRCVMNGELMHMRCVAHIINLIVTSGLKDVDESIISIRKCVKYVRSSPARLKKFNEYAEIDYPGHKAGLVMDVCTRWNSTYLMLESALRYIFTFDRMEMEDADFRAYFNDKDGESGKIGPPSTSDWENARVFVKFLESFYHVTNRVSGSLYVTSNNHFTEICNMHIKIKNWSDQECSSMQNMAISMQAKYNKYWGNVDKMNKLLYIAAVLDPRYKLDFLVFSLRSIYADQGTANSIVNEVKDIMVDLYDFYLANDPSSQSKDGAASSYTSKQVVTDTTSIAFAFECLKEEQDHLNNQNELDVYLVEPKIKSNLGPFDVLIWWKANATKFPILSQIARDVLAVPVSTVASESAFSTGGRILDPFRSSLAPKMVEGLICLQNWIQSSHVSIDLPRQVEDIVYDPETDESLASA